MKIQPSEILLLVISSIITIVVALLLINWLQPSLLGYPKELILVKSSKEVVPYYENIFRNEELLSNEFIIHEEPYIKHRAKPLALDLGILGPNDLLGFRNSAVPNHADIIVIGDSQTYGNNAIMQENWPHFFKEHLPSGSSVYSMATGGWGAIQYFYAFAKSFAFKPEIVIIAFYTGNDPLDTFSMVYGEKIWREFISDPALTANDVPGITNASSGDQQWPVEFSDGVRMTFTPSLRHVSNLNHPAVDAGYKSMVKIARKINEMATAENIRVVFTIIPTKETVYSLKVSNENIDPDQSYMNLVNDERSRIKYFSNELNRIEGSVFVDLVSVLKETALKPVGLYHESDNGHPNATGYNVIGATMASEIGKLLHKAENGIAVIAAANNMQSLIYLEDGEYWIINDPDDLALQMNPENFQVLESNKLSGLHYMGHKNIQDIISGKP